MGPGGGDQKKRDDEEVVYGISWSTCHYSSIPSTYVHGIELVVVVSQEMESNLF